VPVLRRSLLSPSREIQLRQTIYISNIIAATTFFFMGEGIYITLTQGPQMAFTHFAFAFFGLILAAIAKSRGD
jgi:hypothetical protein